MIAFAPPAADAQTDAGATVKVTGLVSTERRGRFALKRYVDDEENPDYLELSAQRRVSAGRRLNVSLSQPIDADERRKSIWVSLYMERGQGDSSFGDTLTLAEFDWMLRTLAELRERAVAEGMIGGGAR